MMPSLTMGGSILLLSGRDSFTAAYIRRSAVHFGVDLVEPAGEPRDAFASLTAEQMQSIVGCIAADVGPALFADITKDARSIPCLFVGCTSGGWFPGPYAWLAPPFSSYQIMDTLFSIMNSFPKNRARQ